MYWLAARVHPTWHLTAACFGVIAGVVLALAWRVPIIPGILVGLGCVIVALWKHRRALLLVAFCGGACLGLVRGTVGIVGLSAYQSVIGQEVTVQGIVSDDVDVSPRGQYHLRVGHIVIRGRAYPGQVWVSIRDGGEVVRRSDTVVVTGLMTEGFGNFAASVTGGKLEHVARSQPGDVALEVRDGFASDVRQTVSEPGASLGIGFLLGQKSALDSDLLDALKIAGLTHIVVASGYNLTILVRIGRRLFAKVSKYLATLSSTLLIVGFIAMTGLSPSMTRAGLVAGLSLWAWYFGRKFHPMTLLGLAAMITVLWNPSYVWGDLGWLLSFGAFAGVMIIGPLLQAYFFGTDKPPLVLQILCETVAATIATVPIIIAAFGYFSNVALLANMLILPFIPITMLFTAIAGIGGIVHVSVLGWVADHILSAMIAVIQWCASLPWAQSTLAWPWWGVLLYVLTVVGGCLYMKYRTQYNLRTANIVE